MLQLSALQSQLDEADARAQSLREEKEQLSFQLANLQEVRKTTDGPNDDRHRSLTLTPLVHVLT